MTSPQDAAGTPASDQPARPEGATHSPRQPTSQPGPGLRALLGYFLGLGTWGFGGPIATVGYMQRDLVERRGWLDRQDFLNGVALGQTMPGPLAAQVAMWVGYLERGPLGALAVSVPFIAPSFLLVLAVAVVYVRYQGLAVVQSLFYGIAPAVMAIIAIAAVKLARLTNQRDARLWGISLVLAAVTALTGADFAWLFVAAGLLMVALEAPPSWRRHPPAAALLVAQVGGQGWLVAAAPAGTQVALGLFFLKAGAFIFGSGLAIVPFLREGVVHQHHWLTERQFLDAVAMGLITPGPVVITATFIGYLVGGLAGALVATVAIFTPIWLGVVVPGRWFLRHQHHAQVQAFVKGATAAAAGAIAGATIVLTRQAVTDLPTALIAVVSLGLLWRFKVNEPLIVLGGAIWPAAVLACAAPRNGSFNCSTAVSGNWSATKCEIMLRFVA
jgi:chromate transporter